MICLTGVPERDGYENSVGETLCNGCHAQLWRQKADQPAQTLIEAAFHALRITRRSVA
jgi:hypothetical protein